MNKTGDFRQLRRFEDCRLEGEIRNLLLTVSYKGTNYHGFQVQKNAVTVCEVLQLAIESVLNHKTQIKGCSRTDTGVHANGYCLSLKTDRKISCEGFVKAVNTKLPNDISVIKCREVPLEFHARYSCIKKEYIYVIWNEECVSPFLFDLTCHYRKSIDEEMLNKQARDFVGTHDFSAFCNFKKGNNNFDVVRTIFDAGVFRKGSLVIFRVCGDGFLYNMVRIMVGTLLFIQEKKINQGSIPDIIKHKNRALAGKTAVAKGLYLNNVYY